MKAARVVKVKEPYRIDEISIPEPEPGEILLKTGAAGYCHTDSMVKERGFGDAKLPLTGSHEPCGTISKLGKGVTGFSVGDRVAAIAANYRCGECIECREGLSLFCPKRGPFSGLNKDGAFAEYVIVDSRSTVKLPSSITFSQAAPLTCAGVTIYNALLRADLKKGELVAIIGLGALGHIGCQLAKCMGYKVVGIDKRQAPLDLAKKLKYSPDLILDATQPASENLKLIDQIDSSRQRSGVDATIYATDNLSAFQYAVDITRKHGTVIVLGQPEEKLPVNFYDLIFRDIIIKGSLLGETKCLQDLVKLVAEHDIPIHVTKYKLEDVNKAVEESHSPNVYGKAVVVFEE